MAYEKKEKDNSGVLFKNKEKKTEKHPDYNGSAIIHGQHYYMSAWINESKKGEKYMSFAFKINDKNKAKDATDKVYAPQEEEDSTIPF